MAKPLILDACDQVAGLIAAKWPPGGGDVVERMYVPVAADGAGGVNDLLLPVTEVEKLKGRAVYVYPKAFGQKEQATRGSDLMAYAVGVQVYEVFDRHRQTAGVPTAAWCDARVALVTELYDLLSNARRSGPTRLTGALAKAWCDEAAVDQVFDPELLRKQKVFWAVLSFTYAVEVAR
jgi:hypothetical protein